jgi:hypothetical protein
VNAITVAKFRILRKQCRIKACEVAAIAKISPQRINQFETYYYNMKPKNPERLISALETLMTQQKQALENAEEICKNERDSMFNYIDEDSESI